MDESGRSWITKQRVHRTLVRNGRTYQAEISPGEDGRVDVSVISIDGNGHLISDLQATVAPEDFELFGTVFTPAFVIAGLREHAIDNGGGVLAEIRKVHPNHGGPWTDEAKQQVLTLHHSGKSAEEIAAEVGRSVNSIRGQLRRMGVEIPYV